MGKSGGRKKKGQNQGENHKPVVNGTVDLDSSIFLKRAHELKEEGNKRFQAKDFVGALQQYDNALKLTPKTHPERAVFHSNRAACMMQMKPIDYDSVISECTMALQVQPRFVRALLRRARALEAVGKYEMAMQDVQMLLDADGNHQDALEIAGRLGMILGPHHDAQQDLQSRPSPAALGASAVGAASIAGLGPCLPSRSMSKKPVPSTGATVVSVNSKPNKPSYVMPAENGTQAKVQLPRVSLKPSTGPSKPNVSPSRDDQKENASTSASITVHGHSKEAEIRWRPLKLVYDHDIRLARMPVNCSFRVLRVIVMKRFPMSKSVLVKYKDSDGDLVTITCTAELRLAESWVSPPPVVASPPPASPPPPVFSPPPLVPSPPPPSPPPPIPPPPLVPSPPPPEPPPFFVFPPPLVASPPPPAEPVFPWWSPPDPDDTPNFPLFSPPPLVPDFPLPTPQPPDFPPETPLVPIFSPPEQDFPPPTPLLPIFSPPPIFTLPPPEQNLPPATPLVPIFPPADDQPAIPDQPPNSFMPSPLFPDQPPTNFLPSPIFPDQPPNNFLPSPMFPDQPPVNFLPSPVIPDQPPTNFLPSPVIPDQPPETFFPSPLVPDLAPPVAVIPPFELPPQPDSPPFA